MPAPRNRIRAYTRWPVDREKCIAQAKTELSAAFFFQRIGLPMPEDIETRSNKAFDVLEKEQIPMSQWE